MLGGKFINYKSVKQWYNIAKYLINHPNWMMVHSVYMIEWKYRRKTWNIKLNIVPNRSAKQWNIFSEKAIIFVSTVIAGRHRSYPIVVNYINGKHNVVDDSTGLRNIDGFHTNNIKNLLSLLKYRIKRKRVKKENIVLFSKWILMYIYKHQIKNKKMNFAMHRMRWVFICLKRRT